MRHLAIGPSRELHSFSQSDVFAGAPRPGNGTGDAGIRCRARDPAARSGAAMAYDPARNRTVLFGGTPSPDDDEVWEWDGVTWRRFDPSTTLRNRFDHAMAISTRRVTHQIRARSFAEAADRAFTPLCEHIATTSGAPSITWNGVLRSFDRIAFVEGREDIFAWAAFDGASVYLPRSRCFSECTTGLWASLAPAVSPPPRRFAVRCIQAVDTSAAAVPSAMPGVLRVDDPPCDFVAARPRRGGDSAQSAEIEAWRSRPTVEAVTARSAA